MNPRTPTVASVAVAAIVAIAPGLCADETVTKHHPDGTPRAIYRVDSEGRRHGTYKSFHPNGKKKVIARFRRDRPHGKCLQYDENGELLLDVTYHEGARHGLRRVYEAGKLHREEAWIDDVLVTGKSRREIDRTIAEIARTRVDTQGAPKEAADALRRLMSYRYLCDVPHEGLVLDRGYNERCVAAALALEKRGSLTHDLERNPGLPEDVFRLAREGAKRSNLSTRFDVVKAVDAYMDDSDPDNIEHVGHRRWCLNPPMLKTGFGRGITEMSALWAMNNDRGDIPDWEYVAYPPRGYLPVSYFGARHAWSVSLNPVSFKRPEKQSVKVEIRRIRQIEAPLENLERYRPIELDFFHIDDSGRGTGPCIIFRPVLIGIAPGAMYFVRIDGLRDAAGEAVVVRYFVVFV